MGCRRPTLGQRPLAWLGAAAAGLAAALLGLVKGRGLGAFPGSCAFIMMLFRLHRGKTPPAPEGEGY
jgi:hypothetical protein